MTDYDQSLSVTISTIVCAIGSTTDIIIFVQKLPRSVRVILVASSSHTILLIVYILLGVRYSEHH